MREWKIWLNIINCCSSSPCIREKKIIARNISSVQPKAFERAIRCDVVPVLVAKVSSERGTYTKVKPPHSFAGENKNCGMGFQNTFAAPTNYFQHAPNQCVERACCTSEPRAAANIMSTAPSLERRGRVGLILTGFVLFPRRILSVGTRVSIQTP